MAVSEPKKEMQTQQDEFTYLPPPRESPYFTEGVKEKFIRKTKENPFVPVGMYILPFLKSEAIYCLQ